MLRHFNLSRNKSLRILETTAESIEVAGNTASGFLKTVLSSVTSPVPLDAVIIYRDFYFSSCPRCPSCPLKPVCSLHVVPSETALFSRCYKWERRVFREMHNVRDFRLVLCADVVDWMVDYAIQRLEYFVKAEKVKGGLDYLLYEPLVISERRTLRTRNKDHNVGWSKEYDIHASAM